ncbi:dTDP-glucose 4,6-dehydratase [Caldiplasma sukawensis]
MIVTGGAGFIGSSFIRLLENPVVFDKFTYAGRTENLKEVKCRVIRGDICSMEDLEKCPQDNIIVNFAAETHVDRSINNPYEFMRTNVMGVFNILEYVRKHDLKLFHISTDEVYGEKEADENGSLEPSSPYSASKASGDLFIKSYAKTYGLKYAIIRPGNAYGPRQYPEKLIPKTIIRSILGMDVPVYGEGNQRRKWIFVDDLCQAVLHIVMDNHSYGVYNIPGEKEYSNNEIIKMISSHTPVKINHVGDRPGHDAAYPMINSRINVRYTPLEKGIDITVKWYMENRWWWENLINDQYFQYSGRKTN